MENDGTITINIDDLIDRGDEFTISLDGTTVTDIVYTGLSTDSTIDLGNYTITDYNNITLGDSWIDPEQVNKMCELYPGLEKAWRNFKSVYDMVKQDYEGKKKSGEIDDDLPF